MIWLHVLISFITFSIGTYIGWGMGRESMRDQAAEYVAEFIDAARDRLDIPYYSFTKIMKTIDLKKQFFR